jgi:ABC-type nitrate/sulfonate/bicarbonate transport system substrate-binding protein
MDKGERIMPVPQGVISTSEGPVDPVQEVVQEVVQVLDEAIAEADKEEAVEEYDDINSDQA